MILENKSGEFTLTFDSKEYVVKDGINDIIGNDELCSFILSICKKWDKKITLIDPKATIKEEVKEVEKPELAVEIKVEEPVEEVKTEETPIIDQIIENVEEAIEEEKVQEVKKRGRPFKNS